MTTPNAPKVHPEDEKILRLRTFYGLLEPAEVAELDLGCGAGSLPLRLLHAIRSGRYLLPICLWADSAR